MANQEENQLHPHFFRAILSLENARMKIPARFVKEHGKTLSKNACLQVGPGGLTWKLGVKRCEEGLVWLLQGWKEFAEYYSIKFGHILMFRYKGKSKFDVSIFDPSLMEIQYPIKALSKSGVEFDQSKVVETEEEETDDEDEEDDEEDDDDEEEEEEEEEEEDDDDDDDDDDEEECSQRLQKTRSNAWTRAKAFKSSNPCFIVRMQPNYVAYKKCILSIPSEHSKKHILGKENKGMFLVGEDGIRCFVNYSIGRPVQCQVRLWTSGWKVFVRKNLLQTGDVCAFELVDSVDMVYKVTIFRLADYEEENEVEEEGGGGGGECPSRQLRSSANQSSEKRSGRSRSAQEEVKQKANAFSCPNPSFIAIMQRYHLGPKTSLYVPQKHAKGYFLEKGDGDICLSNGDKTWIVPYTIEGPPQYRVRLSSAWGPFAKANHLEVGDACVFELVDGAKMAYEVTIFRIADYA